MIMVSGRYVRDEKIRMKQSASMIKMYRKHPGNVRSGRNHPMFGRKQDILSIIEGVIMKTGRDGRQKGSGIGYKRPDWVKNKISETRLRKVRSGEIVYPTGALHSQYGTHQSKDRRMKISVANKDRKPTEETLRAILKATQKRPTKFELAVQQFLEMNHPGEWRYCGDGSVILNGKCPDFINCNGQKKVVLANSVYWHMTKKGLSNRKHVERSESKPYNEIGFDVQFIWDDKFKGLL